MYFSDLDDPAKRIRRLLFRFFQIKHVQNTVVAVDKHDVACVNHAVLGASQPGQLIYA